MDDIRSVIPTLFKQGEYEKLKQALLTIPPDEYTDEYFLYYIKALRKTIELDKSLQFCNVLLERNILSLSLLIHYEIHKIYSHKNDKHKSKESLLFIIENTQDPTLLEKCTRKLSDLSRNPISDQISKFTSLNSDQEMPPGRRFYLVSKHWLDSLQNFADGTGRMPGKIDNSDLLFAETSQDYYSHRSPDYLHANAILKPNLQENLDFVICTEASYKYLEEIYSARQEIVRYSVAINESHNKIEIYLKEIDLAIYPIISRSRSIDKTLLVSHYASISAVLDLIRPILAPFFDNPNFDKKNLRLWKMQREKKLEKSSQNDILVPGKLLVPADTVEDSCISEEDIVIVEHCKITGKWVLSYKEPTERLKQSRPGLVGLQNLGNTCFMNSALQCVLHTSFLVDYFVQERYRSDLNLNNPLGTKGAELAKTYAGLVQDYWKGTASVVSPWEFKKIIAKTAHQFVGYHQHDSHELLSYLLTGLHEDLNRVKKKTYEELPEIKIGARDQDSAAVHWQWFQKRNQSALVDHMYGQCKSTLVCPDCNKVSITFDPVLSFAVVIPNSDIKKIFVNVVQKDLSLPLIRQTLTVKGNWNVAKVKAMLLEHLHKNYFLAIYEKNNYANIASEETEISELFFRNIFAYEDTGEKDLVVPVVLSRAGVKGYFSGTDKKTLPIPRLMKIPGDATCQEIYALISQKFSAIIAYNDSQNSLYSINIVNTSKTSNGIFFSSKLPCDFCHKKCNNCPLPSDSSTLNDLLGLRVNSEGMFQLEIEWVSSTKGLNAFTTFTEETVHIAEVPTEPSSNTTLLSCLKKSCDTERLDENNKWYCNQCKTQVRALKTYEMFRVPEYLVLHLLRFKSKNFQNEKNNTLVEFPVEGLDLSEVIISSEKPPLYDLYAVSNHFGGLGGGHYTAYVKESGAWYEMDDSRVSRVADEQVVTASAYILFYKQRE